MATLHLLGTGAALSDADRTTTMLAVESGETLLLIDCGGDAAQRLLASGLALDRVSGLVVTHEHADHVAGFPLLMERLWLAGIGKTFTVYGIPSALAQARKIHDAFDIETWPDYPTIEYREIGPGNCTTFLDNDDLVVTASPGDHSVPVIGLRFEAKRSKTVMAYSCDTEYSPTIVELAKGADVLVHEASGEAPGHSAPAVAGRVAREAGVGRLVLVHLPPLNGQVDAWLGEASQAFQPTQVGSDGASIEF